MKPKLTLEQCERWRNNPLINPITGEKIKMHGKMYEHFVNECGRVFAEYLEKDKLEKKLKDIYEKKEGKF